MIEISQRPGALNIVYTKGDDLPISIILGVDVAGHTLSAKVIQAKTSTLSTIIITTITAATGSIIMEFPKETFASYPIGSHEWYLINTDGDGNVRKWLAGLFTVVNR